MDTINKVSIYKYLNQDNRHRKKFQIISEVILSNLKNRELYDKEDINKRSKDITAMKFFKGQENDRIYCKEFRSETNEFIIVMCVLHERKKSTRLSLREKRIINTIADYEYEFK